MSLQCLNLHLELLESLPLTVMCFQLLFIKFPHPIVALRPPTVSLAPTAFTYPLIPNFQTDCQLESWISIHILVLSLRKFGGCCWITSLQKLTQIGGVIGLAILLPYILVPVFDLVESETWDVVHMHCDVLCFDNTDLAIVEHTTSAMG
ncbi:hypothetical protein Tco_0184379 [Tanacetum coccineum]